VVRAKTIQVRTLDFVTAARALGQRPLWIVLRHVLPNIAGPLIVTASSSVASMILAESVLSYLSVGVQPPTATWGRMLREGQTYFTADPRLVVVPGVAILLAVLAFNLLGEGLRDALDPRTT
jgi:peptide/nickel transport system permease protein